jgi:hypothetical protein
VIAYKFLGQGAIGPISRVRWPAVGQWLHAGELVSCRSGVHACGREALAWWLHEELWRIEIDGEMIEGADCTIASRGRLVEEIAAWARGGAHRFAAAARDHAQELAARSSAGARAAPYLEYASLHVARAVRDSPALAALNSAMAVAQLDDEDEHQRAREAAFRRERAWQSSWIAATFLD